MEGVLRSWRCYELHSLVASSKKSELRLRSGRLYSQTPHPFWRAMAGCIAIGSRAVAEPLVSFLVLHEPMDVQLHCVITKGVVFFFGRSNRSISQGTEVTIVMSDFVSLCLVFPYPCIMCPYLVLPVSCHH